MKVILFFTCFNLLDFSIIFHNLIIPFLVMLAGILAYRKFLARHEKASVIITTNLGFAGWTQIFGETTLTAALLDRLTYKAKIITCAWKSFRLRESLKRKGSGSPEGKKITTNEGGES